MGKGSGNRVRDTKRYEENYGKIDWSEDRYFEELQQYALRKWRQGMERRCKEHIGRVDGDDGNTTDEAVGTH